MSDGFAPNSVAYASGSCSCTICPCISFAKSSEFHFLQKCHVHGCSYASSSALVNRAATFTERICCARCTLTIRISKPSVSAVIAWSKQAANICFAVQSRGHGAVARAGEFASVYEADRKRPLFPPSTADAVVLIVTPLQLWIARGRSFMVSRFARPPQLWAWAGCVSARCALRRSCAVLIAIRGSLVSRARVNAEYVGHPFFDELPRQTLDSDFMANSDAGPVIVSILPGSRAGSRAQFPHAVAPPRSFIRLDLTRYLIASSRKANRRWPGKCRQFPTLPVGRTWARRRRLSS